MDGLHYLKSTDGERVVAHSAGVFLHEVVRRRFTVVLQISKRLGLSIFGMRLQIRCLIASQIGSLLLPTGTNGFEVVLLQNVEPVGNVL